MEKIVQLTNVTKYYGRGNMVTKALDGISFAVGEGEFTAIMGASGSGKSTLLNVIATIDRVSSGDICIRGKHLPQMKEKDLAVFRREELGFIFQDYNLLDTLTIKENIELALSAAGVPLDKAEERIKQVTEGLEIDGILQKFPAEVSGGEKQRCACARAIVNNAKVVLADEPTGALDSHSSMKLLQLFEKMNSTMNVTILIVTHDVFTASYAKRILFLKDGRIFTEIRKGNKKRREFFNEILDVMVMLGGGFIDVR